LDIEFDPSEVTNLLRGVEKKVVGDPLESVIQVRCKTALRSLWTARLSTIKDQPSSTRTSFAGVVDNGKVLTAVSPNKI